MTTEIFKESNHYYYAIAKLQPELTFLTAKGSCFDLETAKGSYSVRVILPSVTIDPHYYNFFLNAELQAEEMQIQY